MLQIRLRRDPSSDGVAAVKPFPLDTVTVACPDHLVLADLPVAKGIGAATAASLVKTVGRRSRRQLGERVHFCVRCDFPIAIYGRLSPCEHAFCLECARSDSICYLCDERIQKIQTIKMMEGILICAAPHCLKSFLKKTEFESHIHENHANLLQPNAEKEDGKDLEVQSIKQSTGSDSTLRAPPRSLLSPGPNSMPHDHEDKARRQQSRDQLPPRPMMQQSAPFQAPNYPSEPQPDSSLSPGFERSGLQTQLQQGFERQGTPQQESSQFSVKQQGFPSEIHQAECTSAHPVQPPNFVMPMASNSVFPPYGIPQFPTDGAPPFYGAPYEMARPPEVGSEQGSLLGFPPALVGGMNYPATYPRPWHAGQHAMPFEAPPADQSMSESFGNYQGDYGRSPGGLPMASLASSSTNPINPRDVKGVLAPQPLHVPTPPPFPLRMSQPRHGQYHLGDINRDGQGFGWQHDNHDGYGSSQE